MWEAYKVDRYIEITDIYSLFEQHYEKGYRFTGEMHNFWECVYVVSGSVTVTADGCIHKLEAGDIIFHKPFEMHKFFTENTHGVTHFVFSFSATGEFCNEFCDKVFSLNDRQQKIITDMISCYKAFRDKTDLPSDMHPYNRVLSIFPLDRIFPQTIVTYISLLVLSLDNDGQKRPSLKSGDTQNFSRAVDFMKSNISTKISVDELAKYLNVSVSGLKRLFLKYSGLGVHKYFLMLKIKAATECLSQGISVGDTAYKLGFSSQDYFSACYKRETGKCPTEVLRSNVFKL